MKKKKKRGRFIYRHLTLKKSVKRFITDYIHYIRFRR